MVMINDALMQKNNMAKAEINGELYKERGGSWWRMLDEVFTL